MKTYKDFTDKEVEVKELGPIAGFVARAAAKHVAKKVINKATEKKEKQVDELSKGLLNRAANTARDKAGHERHVSKTADTNLDRKRAGYKAAKNDARAFKFSKAADKKEAWQKPRDKDYEDLGPLHPGEMKGRSSYSGKHDDKAKKQREKQRGIRKESHDYFGSGPFTGPKSDLAASVLRIAEKAAKDKEAVEEVKGFEKMSNDKLNQSVKDAYLDKVRGGM